jgi:hypothetical protein
MDHPEVGLSFRAKCTKVNLIGRLGQGRVSDLRRTISAPRQRIGVLDAGQCTCQTRGAPRIRRPPRPRNINEKANSETDRGKMCGVRWDWNYAYGAASAAGPQNLPPCKQCGGKGRVKEAAN